MNDLVKKDLAVAIELMLEKFRPGSMKAKVLEAMVNKVANGLPRLTYDLEKANEMLKVKVPGFQVPTIWELIGLDVAPYPGLWQQVEYAKDNAKAIRNAIYTIKEEFECLNDEVNPDARPIGLYIFNPLDNNPKEVTVVTPMPDYRHAESKCRNKQNNLFKSRVQKITTRSRIAGRDEFSIVRELALALDNARQHSTLSLADELKRIESK